MPVIRRGEAGDLAEIAAIQADCPETAQWEVAQYLEYDLRVAICDSRVAGFLVARHVAVDESELLSLGVAPEFRGTGVARQLVEDFLTETCSTVFLEVRESNSAARSLYKSIGFQPVSTREAYYESPPEAAIVMKFHSC
jgi:[ribosomal protein S18]-alanine N-acetyltransferase